MAEIVSIGTAFVLGLFAFLHPCPLAANTAAISLVSTWSGLRSRLYPVLLFAGGAFVAYTVLGIGLSLSTTAIPGLSRVLPEALRPFIGPLLVFAGMLHSGLLQLPGSWQIHPQKSALARGGPVAAFVGGGILALAFCPATAGLFFGVMLPLAIRVHAPLLVPLLYAAGYVLPILLIAVSASRFISWTVRKPQLLRHLSLAFGWILIGTGIAVTLWLTF